MGDEAKYMTREGLVLLLLEITSRVLAGDCRGAGIGFNGFFTEHEDGTRFTAHAHYRVGNNDGMGGWRTVKTGGA